MENILFSEVLDFVFRYSDENISVLELELYNAINSYFKSGIIMHCGKTSFTPVYASVL